MPSASEIYSGRYLNSVTVKSKNLVNKPLRIAQAIVDLVGQGEKAQDKIVLTLENVDKPLVLNSTNNSILVDAFGDDYSQWVGRVISLQITKKKYQGQTVDGISVTPSPQGPQCEHNYHEMPDGSLQCVECGNVW